ncbi:MAG TPA: NTP transferase domain-containing protein [Rhizomicrobium sp.]|nr:NTP transferase domain-containing protein [Rhizomicrobium sp.]
MMRTPAEAPRIVAIVQARMGSTRLPGKVLRPIAGEPLLWHVVRRLKRSALICDVVIATSTNALDDAIVEFGERNAVQVIRGPEDNVLARFALAAEATDADIIVRVSADAPFIDAGFVDHLVTALIDQNGDYVLLEDGAVTAHEGVDPFSRRALDKLMMDAAHDPVAREHVTGYFKLHPDFVRIARAPAYPQLAHEGGRLTVDTPDDLAFVEAVHNRLQARAGEASLEDLLILLEREPSLRTLNAHVRQKAIARAGALALIRCDGGGGFGYGHVKRMVSLARALRDREGVGAVFAVHGTEDALAPIRRAGFDAKLIESRPGALATELKARHADILICDVREGVSRLELAALADNVSLIAVQDDASDRRLSADIAYYPDLPQAHALEWNGARCQPRIGWEWSLLGLSRTVSPPHPKGALPTLLVTMGGSDPFGLTLQMANALAKLGGGKLGGAFRTRFVIGQGMADKNRIARTVVARSPNFETVEGADDLATEYASADLALTAFGVSAYELAAFGVPALYLAISPDHALSASAFEQAGMGHCLGLADQVSDAQVRDAVSALLGDSARRREMRSAGLMTIDGQGAARIAADLAGLLAARRLNLRSVPA